MHVSSFLVPLFFRDMAMFLYTKLLRSTILPEITSLVCLLWLKPCARKLGLVSPARNLKLTWPAILHPKPRKFDIRIIRNNSFFFPFLEFVPYFECICKECFRINNFATFSVCHEGCHLLHCVDVTRVHSLCNILWMSSEFTLFAMFSRCHKSSLICYIV